MWEQGGKDEPDRWGVMGLANLPSPNGNLVGEGAQGEWSLCPADPFHSNYQRGHDPSDTYAIKQMRLWPAC